MGTTRILETVRKILCSTQHVNVILVALLGCKYIREDKTLLESIGIKIYWKVLRKHFLLFAFPETVDNQNFFCYLTDLIGHKVSYKMSMKGRRRLLLSRMTHLKSCLIELGNNHSKWTYQEVVCLLESLLHH